MAHCSKQEDENNFQAADEIDEEASMFREKAVDAVTFTAVYDENDILAETSIGQFKPEMAHQIFGDSEMIYGYRHLKIDLKYLHNSCRCYVGIRYATKVKDTNLIKADNILEKLDPWLPSNYVTDINTFSQQLADENHKIIYGEVIDEFRDKKEMDRFPNKRMYADYKVTLCDLSPEFIDFHANFETYIIWFIDAANYLDLSDNRWMVFYVYEEFLHPENKLIYRSPIGFCTVYKFYNFPDKYRARISQFFILPTHQKRGIGTKFYQAIVKKLFEMPDIVDIAVEEPIQIFQKIRCFSDALHMYNELKKLDISISSRSQKRILAALKRNKLCKRQSRRILDILNCVEEYKRTRKNYDVTLSNIKARFIRDVEKSHEGGKRMSELAKAVVDKESFDNKKALAEADYSRYAHDLEPIIKRVVNHILNND